MMSLSRKLKGLYDVPVADIDALEVSCTSTFEVAADTLVLREGDTPTDMLVILSGWASRQKILADGGRQIVSFLLPGDVLDICRLALNAMDHDVGALTPIRLARVPRERMEGLLDTRPSLTRAFLQAQLVDEAVMRAWLTNMGRRDAFARLGNLLCELWLRAGNAGLLSGSHVALPLTQVEIADAIGLTPVHVNRVLKRLRDEDLVRLRTSSLEIPDVERLARAVDFDPAYLQIRKLAA